MVAVFREVWRVLRNDGTCWLNLGDSYAGSGGAHTQDHANPGLSKSAERNGVPHYKQDGGRGNGKTGDGLKPKDLVGIPWRVAFALQADGWYLRSDIIWHKPNPMPESVTDRPTKSHEYVFLLAKRERYYYDADAVREAHTDLNVKDGKYQGKGGVNKSDWTPDTQAWNGGGLKMSNRQYNPAGRNRRTVWTIPTRGFPGAHFATFPPALVEPCIKAGTSERGVCPKCGSQWERVVERGVVTDRNTKKNNMTGQDFYNGWADVERRNEIRYTTLGFRPTCTCDAGDPIPAIVLDPFNGAATTGLVAQQLGRRYVGLDLSAAYLQMSRERLGQTALDAWEDGEAMEESGAIDDLPLFKVV